MAAPNSSVFSSDPIHRSPVLAPNSSPLAAHSVHQATVAASSAGMAGAPGAPPTQQVALMEPPFPQGNPIPMTHPAMHGEPAMTVPPQGGPVTSPLPFPPGPPSCVAPPTMVPQPPHAGTVRATHLLQAAGMIARLPLPAGHPKPKRQRPDYSDMPFGPQEMAGHDKSMGAPYIHNEMPSGGSYDRPLPSNASSTLYVDGLPTNCTRRELKHIFRPFAGFCDVRLVNRGFNNRHVIAFVDFDFPAQASSAMESLQGYMFDIDDPYTQKLHLQFSPPGLRSGDGPRGRL